VASGSHEVDETEIERLRMSYEQSLSWRLTRPLRAGRRLVQRGPAVDARASSSSVPDAVREDAIDSWLQDCYGSKLEEIDQACAHGAGEERFAPFRDLDDDLWALLLTQRYDVYPNIKAVLPGVPAPELQELWNGCSGLELASQSSAFYAKLRHSHQLHGVRPLSAAKVLDFGCGWGRLTRYLARDVAPGNLYGCDPLEGILETCRETHVPATLARSEFLPDKLPFEESFDLVYSFSVFTHLSETAAERSLQALHRSIVPGGLLVLTVRPAAYAQICEPLRRAAEQEAVATKTDPFKRASYLFAPHQGQPGASAVWGEHDVDYGETIITIGYIRERWAEYFELVSVEVLLCDPYQVALTLRRR
jgi:SAM-dependent methyltransferase